MKYEKKYLKILDRISCNLKKQRKKSSLTQEELAEIIEFDLRYYQRLESGTQSPNLLTLFKVSKGLKIDISLLLKR